MAQGLPFGTTGDQSVFQQELAGLQATASNFANSCIKDARVRAQYVRDIRSVSDEFSDAVKRGAMTPRAAAERVNALRNHILNLSRLHSSPTGRAYAMKLKAVGRSLSELTEKYAQRLFGKAFTALNEVQQASVYLEIVQSVGRPDPRVVALAQSLGKVGRRLAVVSLVVAVWEISEAEDKPREVARQGVIAGAGIAGGAAVGTGAVAAGVCAATAPACVGVAALIGGVLFAFGADLTFGTLYPSPGRH